MSRYGYGTGLDFDSLVGTIQGIGNDIYQHSENLVKTKADLEAKAIETKSKQLDLNEKERLIQRLDTPVSLTGLFQSVGGDKKNPIGQANTASRIMEVSNAFGMVLEDPENPDPKQGLVFRGTGKKVTNRDIQELAPQMGMYVLATYDPIPNALNTIAGVKRMMGFKSEGATLSPDEVAEASKFKDPEKAKAFKAYQKLSSEFERHQKNPELFYSEQLGVIQQVEGFLRTIPGADTSALSTKRSEIEGYVKKSNEQRVEQQDDIAITGSLARASGLKPGTLMPAPQAGGLGTAHMNLQGDIIKSNASVETARINNDTESMASQRNSFNNIYYSDVPLRVDEKIKSITGPDGRIRVPDPQDPEKVKVLTPQESIQLRENMIQKERITILQDQYDRGMWPKLFPNTDPPDYIDKSPVNIRNEVKQQAGQVLNLLEQLDKNVPLNRNYAMQVEGQLKNVAAGIRSGDTAKMNQARKDLLAVTAQVQEYLKQKRPGLQSEIKKNATRGLPGSGGGGF